MMDFTDVVARAVRPQMSREEREAVYNLVRKAFARMQENQDLAAEDPGLQLQRHLVEETIRDIEAEVVRFQAMEVMRKAAEAQDAENARMTRRR